MKAVVLVAILMLAVPVLAGDPHQHPMKTASGWFDLEGCAFCKNLIADPALLPHMQWENHTTASGALSITVVDPQHKAAYDQAMTAMTSLGEKMHRGEVDPASVKMCGHCTAYGELMMAGAKVENVDGEAADATLITSDDPQLVAKIHEFNNRTNREMAELMSGGHSH
jgi:hypothetical protein